MSKVLVIGDLHLKERNAFETNLLLKKIYEEAQRELPDFIVLLGDTLDKHEIIHLDPFIRAVKFLEKLIENFKVFLLIGNHDLRNSNQYFSSEHAFYPLKNKSSNLVIVDEFTCYQFKGINFLFFPFLPDNRFLEAYKENWDLNNSNAVIFAHQRFKGTDPGSFEVEEWPKEFPLLISGHIHQRTVRNNLIYVGTPMQHSFDEEINKSFSVFTFNSSKDFSERLVQTGITKLKTLTFDFKDLEANLDFINKEISRFTVRLVILANKAEKNLLMKKKYFKDLIKQKVKIVFKYKEASSLLVPEKINKSFLETLESRLEQENDPEFANFASKVLQEFKSKKKFI
jgi:DNA repair exonuclease SbcCD nuclease subunit